MTLFRLNRKECNKRCEELYNSLKEGDFLGGEENKFSLSADKLDKAVVLEQVLSMEEARQPMFAKKPTAGNSNT